MKKLELVENNLELAKEFHQIFKIMEQEVGITKRSKEISYVTFK